MGADGARLDGVLPAAAAGLDELPASAYMVRGAPDAFTVTLLTHAKPNYKALKQTLAQNWSGAKPQIQRVYELRNVAQLERYAQHKAELRAAAEGVAPREQRRFLRARHAPECQFGIHTAYNTCGRADCAVRARATAWNTRTKRHERASTSKPVSVATGLSPSWEVVYRWSSIARAAAMMMASNCFSSFV